MIIKRKGSAIWEGGLKDSRGSFQALAATAKANCPVSKLFKGADITLDAKLA